MFSIPFAIEVQAVKDKQARCGILEARLLVDTGLGIAKCSLTSGIICRHGIDLSYHNLTQNTSTVEQNTHASTHGMAPTFERSKRKSLE